MLNFDETTNNLIKAFGISEEILIKRLGAFDRQKKEYMSNEKKIITYEDISDASGTIMKELLK